MFRRKKTPSVEIDILDIPDIEQLEQWVLKLIDKLELTQGEFTILPAYGGVLIYIKNQGISWVPYSEIRLVEGQVDKNKLVGSGALLGGLAIVQVTGGIMLPFLLIPSVIRGWYRTTAKPSPKKSMTFLQSMIDVIQVEKTKLHTKLLDRFEDSPVKKQEVQEEMITYTLHIKKKYLNKKGRDKPIVRFFKYLSTIYTGIDLPIFAIHPQSDTLAFLDNIQKYGIKVEYLDDEKLVELPDDGIVIN